MCARVVCLCLRVGAVVLRVCGASAIRFLLSVGRSIESKLFKGTFQLGNINYNVGMSQFIACERMKYIRQGST
jgi:hypothetical protein